MLKDLSEVIQRCRDAFDSLAHRGDIHIDSTLAFLLKEALTQVESDSAFDIQPFSVRLTNANGLRTDLPSSNLWYGATFWELDKALVEYQNVKKNLKTFLRGKGHVSEAINNYLKSLPSKTIAYDSEVGRDVNNFIVTELSSDDSVMFRQLLSERDWWFQPLYKSEQTIGKTFDRTDVFDSAFNLAARVIVDNSSRLRTLVSAFTVSESLREYFAGLSKNPVNYLDKTQLNDSLIEVKAPSMSYHKAVNEIYYGAPGTGKSHTIDERTSGKRKVVTVFHPDTQHADFVGTLKPTAIGNSVTYQFRPGPFVNALITATNFPDEHVYLVIEEINRAPAASVFGELFQLLDRKDGESKYPIDAADPDLLAYVKDNTSGSLSKLSIPSNLSILATMNSSDQAVMPLDTAFKRRWSFRYIRIDFENPDISKQYFKILTKSGPYKITWRNFADKVINQLLKELRIPEDRLLGPFFLSSAELCDETTAAESLCGKLFVYLWDDVLRHKGRSVIFNEDIGTFGELHDHFTHRDKPVFSDKAESLIIQFGNSATTENKYSETSAEDV